MSAVTQADIQAAIASEHYFTAADGLFGVAGLQTNGEAPHLKPGLQPLGLLTFCVLVLRNGHTVTGEAYCADPAKFVASDGRVHARADAIRKLWPMVVYAAREADAAKPREPILVVDVENSILGNSNFWRGPVSKLQDIRNIPARECAMLVAKDGKARSTGMWRVRIETEAA